MPVILLERLPLPNLSTYTSFSIFLLLCALWFSHFDVIQHYDLAARNTTDAKDTVAGGDASQNDSEGVQAFNLVDHWHVYLLDMMTTLLNETWCVWTLINMVYCCLILVGKTIQNMVFGELRVSEQEHLRDKFWNFVFYKFIFIFGVMNVQSMDDVLMWCGWFSVLGFLQFLAQLCKDRFEYLSFSPMTSRWTHIRVLALLSTILAISCSLVVVSVFVGFQAGFHTFAFLAAECILLILSTVFVVVRYSIHLWELNHEGIWENRATYLYYTELVFDLFSFSIDFAHHLHMLIWGNIFLSMANLVICMQLRYLFYEFQRRVHRHQNYLRVVRNMEQLYPSVTRDDVGESDQCAICWDELEVARKLPCGHLFHNSCLRSWLEQDSSCPTCRIALTDPQHVTQQQTEAAAGSAGVEDDGPPAGRALTSSTNHFFQFDGSRYVSWLPSFSVEVTHTRLAPVQPVAQPNDASHLNQLARQVQSVFPHMPLAALQEDLQVTLSVDLTIENILEGRLVAPPTSMYPQLTQSDSADLHNMSMGAHSSSGNHAQGHGAGPSSSSRRGPRATLFANAAADDTEADHDDRGQHWSKSREFAAPSTANSFQFSKNPAEREQMLSQRKKALMESAKTRFLAQTPELIDDEDEFSSDDVAVSDVTGLDTSPRELAYLAAVRRRQVCPHSAS